MDWIIYLIFGLFVWALSGHVLWLIIRWPFVYLQSKSCSNCGNTIREQDLACRKCGWTSVPVDTKKSLLICRQGLEAALRRQLIDQETMNQGLSVLTKLEKQLANESQAIFSKPPQVVSQASGTTESPVRTEPIPNRESAVSTAKPKEIEVHALDRDYDQDRNHEVSRVDKLVPASAKTISPQEKTLPTKTWTEVFSAFMEESNIRWGEIIGGLLIVCCSTALVISFWEHIASRPWLKFSIFTGINVSTFGLGLYAWHRWKIPTTAKGILAIGMMQMPLNFLAFALFTMGLPWDWTTVAGEMISMAILGYLAFLAAKILTPGAVPITTSVPVVFGLANLLVRRTVEDAGSIPLLVAWALGLIAVYAAGQVIARSSLQKDTEEGRYAPLLEFFAISTFAVLLPLGLLLRCSGHALQVFGLLSPMLTLLATPALLIAIDIAKRLKQSSSLLVPMYLLGTIAVAIGGLSVIFSWPSPLLMIASGVGLLVMLAVVSWSLRENRLVYPASLIVSVLVVLGWYGLTGQIEWMNRSSTLLIEQLMSPTTGFVWVGYSLVCIAIAGGLARIAKPEFSRNLMLSAVLSGGLGTVLLTAFGLGREAYSTSLAVVYGLYAVTAMGIGMRRNKPWLEVVAIGFLVATSFQWIVVGWTDLDLVSRSYAGVFGISLALLVAQMVRKALGLLVDHDQPVVVASFFALISCTGLAAIQSSAIYPLLIASLLWLIFSWVEENKICWKVTQCVALSSAVVGVMHACTSASWWPDRSIHESVSGLVHPMFIQYLSLCFFGVGIGLLLLDEFLRRVSGPACDAALGVLKRIHDSDVAKTLVALGAILTIGMMVYGAIPGTSQEVIPRDSLTRTELSTYVQDGLTIERTVPELWALEINPMPHAAASLGRNSSGYRLWGFPPILVTWGVGFFALASVCWSLRKRADRSWIEWAGLLCALLISLWYPLATLAEPSVAVASSLRWITASVLLVACLLLSIWIRRVDRAQEPHASDSFALFDKLFSIFSLHTMAPWVGIGTILVSSVLMQAGQTPRLVGFGAGFLWVCLLLLGASALGLILMRSSFRADHPNAQEPVWPIVASTLLISPLLAWTLLTIAVTVIAHPLTGPDPDSVFSRMGLAGSFAVPILMIAAGLIAVAASRPSPRLAFVAALFLMASMAAGYLLVLKSRGLSIEAWVGLVAILSATASVYGAVWNYVTSKDTRSDALLHWPGRAIGVVRKELQLALSQISAGFAVVGIAMIVVLALIPQTSSNALILGACGILVAVVLHFVRSLYDGKSELLLPAWIAAAGAACMGIVSPNFSTIYGSLGASGAVILLAGVAILLHSTRADSQTKVRINPRSSLAFVIAIAVALGIRAFMASFSIFGSAKNPEGFVAIAILLGACALASAATWIHSDRWAWVSSLLLAQLAAVFYTLCFLTQTVAGPSPVSKGIFLQIGLAALSSGFASACGFGRRTRIPLQLATFALFASSAFWLTVSLNASVLSRGTGSIPVFPLSWFGLAIVACLIGGITGFWNRHSKDEHTVIYLAGLSSAVWLIHFSGVSSSMLLWLSTIVLAAYCLASSFLWSSGKRIQEEMHTLLRIPNALDKPSSMLVVPMNTLLAVGVTFLGILSQFVQPGQNLRFLSANAIMAVVVAIGFMARYASIRGSTLPIRVLGLAVGVVYAVALFWHVQAPDTRPLERLAVASLPLILTAAVYGFGLIKWFGDDSHWLKASTIAVPWIVALAIVLGVATVLIETQGVTRMDWYSSGCMILSLVLSMIACLAAAILPGKEPLGLSERGKEAYVYGVQAILVLLIVHLRITMPFLFTGFLQSIWPLLAVVVGFAGVGGAQWSERRGLTVLANPLRNSGSLLPLLPILAPWIAPSSVDQGATMMLSAVGYGMFGYLRSSPLYVTASIVCANIAFWQLLSKNDFSFALYPQLWVIPPALCVFAAGQFFKDRLESQQLASIRYASIGSIYVASTSEMFLQGIGKAPWLPIVLAFLSVLGILIGIAARIRSMLWLGSMFLCVAMFSILWYAAVDLEQTWLWYVCGIVLGALMLFVFAMFEKRREELKKIMSNVQTWEE